MHSNQISSACEILRATENGKQLETLRDFCRLVDNVGVDEVFKRMEGDTFWKLYTYFKNTLSDGDK